MQLSTVTGQLSTAIPAFSLLKSLILLHFFSYTLSIVEGPKGILPAAKTNFIPSFSIAFFRICLEIEIFLLYFC
jgi:hypothetical protein